MRFFTLMALLFAVATSADAENEQSSISLSQNTANQVEETCSGLMKPDTHLGENACQIEVSDDQTTPYLFR